MTDTRSGKLSPMVCMTAISEDTPLRCLRQRISLSARSDPRRKGSSKPKPSRMRKIQEESMMMKSSML